jgi:hypothetical protein
MWAMKKERSTQENEGVFSVRFGPPGTPDRDALDELTQMGSAAKPAPVARNQMIRVAVREYVERHRRRKAAEKN